MDPASPDWSAAGMPALFVERLHYLHDPVAVAAAGDGAYLERLLRDHWRRCRPGRGPAWGPYPTARRTLDLLRVWAALEATGEMTDGLRVELGRHTRVAAALLAVRLERHSRGNHLLSELAALACLGRVWGGRGRPVLDRLASEASRQFLAAGGHHERSPRYHLDVVQDLLEVLLAWGDDLPDGPAAALRGVVSRGLAFGLAMRHGDGDVALFNDGALDDGLLPAELAAAAAAAGIAVVDPGGLAAREEGYFVVRRGAARLLVDCGPVGPPDQPAHAHCDVLSFELSDGPRRVVGNRGTSTYSGPDRAAARGTAAHSTLQFGDLEQAELIGDFRAGRRPAPELLDAGPDRIRGRLAWSQGPAHERSWTPGPLDCALLVTVTDRVTGAGDRPAVARFHLPDATDVVVDRGVRWRVAGAPYVLRAEGGSVIAKASSWHPQPGAVRPAWTVEVRLRGAEATTTIARGEP